MKNALVILATLFTALTVQAQKASISVTDARVFAPIKGTNATAGYGTITNNTDKPIKLSIDKVVPFAAVELHETVAKEGRMAMQKIAEFTVPAKGTLDLKPGGNHIMLFDATRAVKENETLKVVFKVDGKNQELDFKVVPRVQKEEHAHH